MTDFLAISGFRSDLNCKPSAVPGCYWTVLASCLSWTELQPLLTRCFQESTDSPKNDTLMLHLKTELMRQHIHRMVTIHRVGCIHDCRLCVYVPLFCKKVTVPLSSMLISFSWRRQISLPCICVTRFHIILLIAASLHHFYLNNKQAVPSPSVWFH